MIYAASDLHGRLIDPPHDAHLLLLVGDICPDFPAPGRGYAAPEIQAQWLDTNFRSWLKGHDLPTIAVWGNHDFVGEHPELVPSLPMKVLQDSEVEFADYELQRRLRIWGTPWVPGLPRWAFFANDTGLALRAELIPEGIDILMSHGPPYRAGDYIGTSEKQRNKYGNYGGINAGERQLAEAIRLKKPKVTLCGHIHEARGRHWLSGNRVLNVAAVDERYNVHEQPWTRVAFNESPPTIV